MNDITRWSHYDGGGPRLPDVEHIWRTIYSMARAGVFEVKIYFAELDCPNEKIFQMLEDNFGCHGYRIDIFEEKCYCLISWE